MPPNGLPLALLFGASFFRVLSSPLPASTSHSLWFTSLNLRGLSQARVRCTHTSFPMCPCPLLPWASRVSVHRHPGNVRSNPNNRTETRPDAPTHPPYGSPRATRRTDTPPRPPRSQTPVPAEADSPVQALGFRSTVSHEFQISSKDQILFPLVRIGTALAVSFAPSPCGEVLSRPESHSNPTQDQKSRARWAPASALHWRPYLPADPSKGVRTPLGLLPVALHKASGVPEAKTSSFTIWTEAHRAPNAESSTAHSSSAFEETEASSKLLPSTCTSKRTILVFSRQRTRREAVCLSVTTERPTQDRYADRVNMDTCYT
jgi:hypothetical protein